MSPIAFVPLTIPHNASRLFWLTFVGMLMIVGILERLGKPRSVAVWMALGYIVGLFYGRGDMGGLLGAFSGFFLGVASACISARKS